MPEREIKLGLMTYLDEDKVSRWALQGQTVNVHADDIERFDELNVDMGPPHDPQKEAVSMVAPGGAEKPQPQKRAPAKKAT